MNLKLGTFIKNKYLNKCKYRGKKKRLGLSKLLIFFFLNLKGWSRKFVYLYKIIQKYIRAPFVL